MPPKKDPKKNPIKDKGGKGGKDALAGAAPPKPKKISPPPACFTPEDLARFKEVFKFHDEDNIDMVKIKDLGIMLRKLGFNPKPVELNKLCETFLEDEYVDTIEYHEFLQMIEAKMQFGDEIEKVICDAMRDLGHDDEETGFVDFEVFRDELMQWGDLPIEEVEFMDWVKLALKDKTYNSEDGSFAYSKFVDNMNAKDSKFLKEPINFFKLDQKTLAAMAVAKQAEERAAEEKKAAEQAARAEAKRQRMIAEGLIPPD